MIEINNLTPVSIDKSFFKKIARKILKEEKKNDLELSIALVARNKIRELNRKYRGENRPTDVLAFNQLGFITKKEKKGKNLGEVVICPEEIKKNALRFDSSFKEELMNCLIHGVLHLLGYDHENFLKEAKLMEKKQRYYFLKIFQKTNG